MAKSEWGMKRTCLECGAPFYDLKKKNINCPKCGAAFDPAPPAKPKRLASVGKPAPKPDEVAEEAKKDTKPPATKNKDADEAGTKAAAGKSGKDGKDGSAEDGPEANDAEAGDDDDKDLIEDTSDLGRDEDDMSEVKEHIDSGVEDKN